MSRDNSHTAEDIIRRVKTAYDIETDADLARFLGVGRSTPGSWKSRNTVDYELIFAKCKDLNFNWLLKGEGHMRSEDIQISNVAPEDVDSTDMSYVPIYDTEISAGNGRENQNARVIGRLGIKTNWLRRELGVQPERAFVAKVVGDSMRDFLYDGDHVIAEMQSFIDREGMFVVRYNNHCLVKHVQVRDRAVHLISENPVYPPIEVENPDAPEFDVLGRVVRRITR